LFYLEPNLFSAFSQRSINVKHGCHRKKHLRIRRGADMKVRSKLFAFLACSLALASPGNAAEYFWSSSSACIERQLQVQRIREGLRAGFIELRLAELGHGSVKGDKDWTPPQVIEDTAFKGIDQYILDLRIICRLRYPG
jgi:hypothetical protein